MGKLSKCIYGGGESCERQGGNGSTAHVSSYLHPYPTAAEVGAPVDDPVEPLTKGEPAVVALPGLDDFFDEDLAAMVLSLSFDKAVDSVDLVRKSLYEFDLETDDGLKKLMESLPIMDPEIMQDLMSEIWSGYTAEDMDPQMMRAELKGYFLDILHGQASENTTETS